MLSFDAKARVCATCGKPFETMAYVYIENGVRKRDYFHSKCFRTFKATL